MRQWEPAGLSFWGKVLGVPLPCSVLIGPLVRGCRGHAWDICQSHYTWVCVICIIQPVPYLGWRGLHFPAFLTGLRRLSGRDRCCQTRRNIPWRSGLQGRGGNEEHGMLRTHLHPKRNELPCPEGCSGPGCAQELCTGLVFSNPASAPMRTADLGQPSSAACVSPHGSVGRTGSGTVCAPGPHPGLIFLFAD